MIIIRFLRCHVTMIRIFAKRLTWSVLTRFIVSPAIVCLPESDYRLQHRLRCQLGWAILCGRPLLAGDAHSVVFPRVYDGFMIFLIAVFFY